MYINNISCIAVSNEIWGEKSTFLTSFDRVIEHYFKHKGDNYSYIFILNSELFSNIFNNYNTSDIDIVLDKFLDIADYQKDYAIFNI